MRVRKNLPILKGEFPMSKNSVDSLRAEYTQKIFDFISENFDCDVCRTATGTIMIPAVDSEGEDRWVRFVISIPNASEEDGTDGYSLAEAYKLKLEEDRAKAEARAKAKEEKLAKAKAKKEKKES